MADSITAIEKKRAQKRAKYALNPEKERALSKTRYWEDPDQARASSKAWYEAHPEQVKARNVQWRKDNPERYKELMRISAQAKKARKLEQFVEHVDPQIVYQMHGGMCGICEEFVAYNEFEVDHVIPLAKGGMHGYVNVQPAHSLCNRKKWAHLPPVR
jgi:5-methylcytosine-specific restriction endonuclease McrA